MPKSGTLPPAVEMHREPPKGGYMSSPSTILFPHEALSLHQICTQPAKGKAIETFSGALTILSRIWACEEIHLYIATPYETGEVLKLIDRSDILDSHHIEPVLGYSISMCFDAESGKYDTLDSMSARIMKDDLLSSLCFPKSEIAINLRDLAERMDLTSNNGLIPVNIPTARWAGKPATAIYAELKDEYSLEVIAMVMDRGFETKTEYGRALAKAKGDTGKREEMDARTYQRIFDNFLCRGNAKYLLTFDE